MLSAEEQAEVVHMGLEGLTRTQLFQDLWETIEGFAMRPTAKGALLGWCVQNGLYNIPKRRWQVEAGGCQQDLVLLGLTVRGQSGDRGWFLSIPAAAPSARPAL